MSKSVAESAAKRDTQKLQRAVVDGLENVKAQDIKVFDTEQISALFERVIIASGTSNRQTKALAASVRDRVKAAGFAPPRVEGEDNGEWIIVDCGPVVAHIMQPTFRQYYHLEELWGERPLRLKLGAPAVKKPATKVPAAKGSASATKTHSKLGGRSAAKSTAESTTKAAAVKKAAVKSSVGKATPVRTSGTVAKKAPARKPAVKAGGKAVRKG
jgi:ribosome-associated protein